MATKPNNRLELLSVFRGESRNQEMSPSASGNFFHALL